MKWSLLLITCTLSAAVSAAEDDDWGDDWQEDSALSITHELSYAYAGIVKSESANRRDAVMNEFKWLSQIDYQGNGYSVNSELLLDADFLLDDYDLNFRQLNLLIPVGSQSDLKIGRQVITWGTGDLLFLNDLFAKDWQSFFNGRDNRYLKPPVDAIRYSRYSDVINLDVAWQPEFHADNVPNGERYAFYIPQLGIQQPEEAFNFIEPDRQEFALRLFKNQDGVEWAIYGYSGFFKSPSRQIPDGDSSYASMDSIGASIRWSLAGGLMNVETVYYRSNEDRQGTDPLIQNSQSRLLLGYEKEIESNLTFGIQAYLEKTLDYAEFLSNLLPGQAAVDENRTMLTFRLTQLTLQQNLMNTAMLFYSPSDEDYYLRYSSRYTFSDQWKVTLGLNLLGGERKATFLAQMQDNNNLFMRVQYNFN